MIKEMYSYYQTMAQEELCVVNEKSKIIHSPECRYLQKSNLGGNINRKELLFRGYRPCTCCGNEQMWRRIYWQPISKQKRDKSRQIGFRKLPLTDRNIQHICNQFGIKCTIGENIVFLATNRSRW